MKLRFSPVRLPNLALIGFGLGLITIGYSQVPNVQIKLNVRACLLFLPSGVQKFQLYDPLGRLSTVGLLVQTDPGINFYFSQKLQQIPLDADRESLDEYYAERGDVWRIGKQYLEFGNNSFLNESTLAVRADHRIAFRDLPITLEATAGQSGRTQGVIAELGYPFKVAVAIGRNFGIGGTSFALVTRPENGLDQGHGYGRVYDLSYASKPGTYTFAAEAASFQAGETATEPSDTLTDFSVQYKPNLQHSYLLGITHSSLRAADFYRAEGRFQIQKGFDFEPILRFKNGNFYDFTLELHVKL